MTLRPLARLIGRHLPPLRGKERLLRLLDDPDRCPDHPFEVAFHGMRYPGNLQRFIDWSVYYYGAYARHELTLLGDLIDRLEKRLGRRIVAYDIGANVGHHTLFLAGRCRQVVAFEPLPQNVALIEEKIARNDLENVTVVETALGDSDREATIHYPDSRRFANTGTASLLADYNANNTCERRVRVQRCDALVERDSLPPPDLVKIDVEGFEPAVLAGMAGTLADRSPAILFETSERTRCDAAARGTLALLRGYSLFALSAAGGRGDYRLTPLADSSIGVAEAVVALPG
ncbi:FkbM family methyltransferase [Endothiovibrio diazotrophicus]